MKKNNTIIIVIERSNSTVIKYMFSTRWNTIKEIIESVVSKNTIQI